VDVASPLMRKRLRINPSLENVVTAPAHGSVVGDTPMVLLADDDDDARDLVARTIRQQGFRVHESADGGSLLAAARSALEGGERVTLVLSDINMPPPDGLSVTRQLLDLEPTLHVVLMSAFADATVLRKARAAGAQKVLRKPFAVGMISQILMSLTR
jgi:CheY-like chemotaxis protein